MKRTSIQGLIAIFILALPLTVLAVPRYQRLLKSDKSIYKQLREAPVSLSVNAEMNQHKNGTHDLDGYDGEMGFGFGYALGEYGDFSFTPKISYSANDTDGTIMNMNNVVYGYSPPGFLSEKDHGIAASIGFEYDQDISEGNQDAYGEFSTAMTFSRSLLRGWSLSGTLVYWVKNRINGNAGNDNYGFVYKLATKVSLTKNLKFSIYAKYYDKAIVGGDTAQKLKFGPALGYSIDQNVSLDFYTSMTPLTGTNGKGIEETNTWQDEIIYSLAISISVF